ncbi:MAG: CHAT domain-containing protein, partial [Bacteroidetes bacterium]
QIFDLKMEINALNKQIENENPDYYRLKYNTRVITVEEVQNILTPDQALLEYFVGDSSIFAFFITPNGFTIKEIQKDFPLEGWVTNLRKGLYDYWLTPSNLRTNALYDELNALYVENAFALYQKLIAPLGELPEKLVIVPDGVLGYVPFEVFLTEIPTDASAFKTHKYLGKEHQISYNFSATLWHEMREKAATGNGVLAFAPSFETDSKLFAEVRSFRRNNLGALTHNVSEVEQINALVGGEMFLGTDATAENFSNFAPGYAILHLATHAKLDDRNSDYAFLAFAGISDSTDTGKIFIRDLYNMRLPAEMVVLSACETGIGELQRGEGIISLARGFTYAGAKSIVTSLWEVNDKAASEIMVDFYKNLKAGQTKDAALQNAKMTYLDRQIEHRNAHPFFWATFVGMGDMSAVRFGAFPWIYVLWSVLGVALVFLFFRWFKK